MPIRPHEVDAAYAAAQKVVETHHALVQVMSIGMTLAEIDLEVAKILHRLGCRSCFLHYKPRGMTPFPGHSCLSVNDCIVHGHPGAHKEPMRAGDVLSVDIGVTYKGWIGDAAWTYAFGHASDENMRLMQCGKDALARGIEKLQVGRPWIDWAREVQTVVEKEYGYHCVRNLGGHGYGKKLHAPPYISNTVPLSPLEWPEANKPAEAGTLVAVEPMVAVGTGQRRESARKWPIFTADGSMSVHYEADILLTDKGPRNLTEGMTDLPDIIGG